MSIPLLIIVLVFLSAALAKFGWRFYRERKPRPAVQEMQDDSSER